MNSIICKSENYTYAGLKEVEKMEFDIRETIYQHKHRKIKDRYATSKFYGNNFKKGKRKKK